MQARSIRTGLSLPWFLLAPSAAVILVFVAVPVAVAVILSLTHTSPILPEGRFVGLANFVRMSASPHFWHAVMVTVLFTVVSVGVELMAGVAVALLLHERFPGRPLVRTAILVPWAVPTIVSARMWQWMLDYNLGVVNYLLGQLGMSTSGVSFFGSGPLALLSLVVVDAWKTTPFVALIVLAGLEAIPEELSLAARVDGAGLWQRFRHITLPLLAPVIVVAGVFRAIDAMRVFDIIFVLTRGGPGGATESLSYHAYMLLFGEGQFGMGSAVSLAMFLLVFALSALLFRVARFSRMVLE